MPSSREYLSYIMEQLAPLDAQIAALKGSGSDMEAITAHASELAELAVEEVLYVPAALALLPNAPQEPPYPDAKPMLLVEEVDDGAFLRELLVAMEPELPAPKPKKPMAKKE